MSSIEWIIFRNAAVCVAVAVLGCISGCAVNGTHYGYTEAQWQAMNDAQQAKAKAEFEQLQKSREEDKERARQSLRIRT